jgi:hypothetical protein
MGICSENSLQWPVSDRATAVFMGRGAARGMSICPENCSLWSLFAQHQHPVSSSRFLAALALACPHNI